MSLIRWNPMWEPFGEVDEVLNRLPALTGTQPIKAFVPALDVYETDKAVVVETPLAGVDAKDVKVNVEKGVLTISGETKKEHEAHEKNYYRKEVRSGSFYREVVLPTAVVENKVSAEFEDGLLKITCPKEVEGTTKKIAIKITKKEEKK